MVTFTQYRGLNFSSVVRFNYKIFYTSSKSLLNSRDPVIEVTFFHITVFMKFVVTPWKIGTVISFYRKALKCLPEKYWNKNFNFHKSIQNYPDKSKLNFWRIDSWGLSDSSPNSWKWLKKQQSTKRDFCKALRKTLPTAWW